MDPLKVRLAAIEEEAEQLRKQVAALAAERDELKRLYLDELARQSTTVSQAELDSAIPTGPWFDEFLRRLESGDERAISSWPTR